MTNDQVTNDQFDEILAGEETGTSDEPNEGVELQEEQESTPEAIIETLQQELAAMKDQWLRSVADADNIRKRAERDQAETRKYATTEFARDMVSVSENLHRALDNMTPEMLASEESKALTTLHAGVDMTRSELLRTFERHGLKRILPERGQMFDHNLHQAVSQIEDAEVENGAIAQVIQAGYQMHDRLLQPAMVAVAKSASSAA